MHVRISEIRNSEMNSNPDKSNRNYLKRLLNVREASEYLGISIASVYKFVEFGMISYRRMPSIPRANKNTKKNVGRIVFEIKDLDQFVDELTLQRN